MHAPGQAFPGASRMWHTHSQAVCALLCVRALVVIFPECLKSACAHTEAGCTRACWLHASVHNTGSDESKCSQGWPHSRAKGNHHAHSRRTASLCLLPAGLIPASSEPWRVLSRSHVRAWEPSHQSVPVAFNLNRALVPTLCVASRQAVDLHVLCQHRHLHPTRTYECRG